jgi:hypothetical protein
LNYELGFLNIKFEGNAKFLEARPIRVIRMALNVEGCNGKKKREHIQGDRPLEGNKREEENL